MQEEEPYELECRRSITLSFYLHPKCFGKAQVPSCSTVLCVGQNGEKNHTVLQQETLTYISFNMFTAAIFTRNIG